MKMIKRLLPHILLILSCIVLTFVVLDDYNPTMEFLSNAISQKLLAGFCILSIINAIMTMICTRREIKENIKEN